MRFAGGFVPVVLVIAPVVLANGGPIDCSRILGTGRVEFASVEHVELVSEDLSFVVEGDFVDVEVIYVLENSGPARRMDFAFPVDFVSDNEDMNWLFEEDGPVPGEVTGFTISQDGRELQTDPLVMDTSEVVIEEYTYTRSTCWFTTSFALEAGATDTLTVVYRFEPYFLDAAFSKSWLPYWSDRTFTYRLDPAGSWGDGVVDRFSWRIDMAGVMEAHDSFDLPGEGSWINDTVYGWTGTDVDLRSAGLLAFSYDVRNRMASRYILEYRVGPEDITAIRASSVLSPQGSSSYGPENLLDLDFETAWCPGGSSDGVGSWIEIDLGTCLVGEIYLVNGYAKDAETFAANSRIRSLRLTMTSDPDNPYNYSDSSWEIIDDVVTLEDEPWQDIDAGNFTEGARRIFSTGDMGEPAGSIRIEVLEVYPGTTWDDLCLTEVLISGYDSEVIEDWQSD